MGLPVAIIYLITLFLFIPFPFINWFEGAHLVHEDDPTVGTFPYNKVSMVAFHKTCLLMYAALVGGDTVSHIGNSINDFVGVCRRCIGRTMEIQSVVSCNCRYSIDDFLLHKQRGDLCNDANAAEALFGRFG